MTSSLDSLLPPFLQLLRVEEQLLRDAGTVLGGVHAALRRGDLAAVMAAGPEQEALAAALSSAESARATLLADLAFAAGVSPDGLTLAVLAAALPEPWAGEVQAARDRLVAVAAEVNDFRLRNANLISHLRSYFRGVLSTLTAVDAPVRYGPSGMHLSPASGGVIQARG